MHVALHAARVGYVPLGDCWHGAVPGGGSTTHVNIGGGGGGGGGGGDTSGGGGGTQAAQHGHGLRAQQTHRPQQLPALQSLPPGGGPQPLTSSIIWVIGSTAESVSTARSMASRGEVVSGMPHRASLAAVKPSARAEPSAAVAVDAMVRNNIDFSKKCGTFGCQLADGHPGLHVIPTEDGGRRKRKPKAHIEIDYGPRHAAEMAAKLAGPKRTAQILAQQKQFCPPAEEAPAQFEPAAAPAHSEPPSSAARYFEDGHVRVGADGHSKWEGVGQVGLNAGASKWVLVSGPPPAPAAPPAPPPAKPPKPKQHSAYTLYVLEQKDAVQAAHPAAGWYAVQTLIGDAWRKLPDDAKAAYAARARALKEQAPTPPPEAEEEFAVERIVASRVVDGRAQYLVRWEGYGAADDTWEAKEALEETAALEAWLKANKPPAAASPRKPAAAPPSDFSLVGRRVEVLVDGSWTAGRVTNFDPLVGKHTIQYEPPL